MTWDNDPHLAVGAYVLHALPPGEEAAFENHLAACDACRQEVADLMDVTAELATAESTAVPPHLRAHVLDAVTGIRQELPARTPTPARRSAWRYALAACAVVAAALAGVAAWQYSEADTARTDAARIQTVNQTLTDVLTAPDTTLHTGKLADGATVAVAVSRGQGRAVLTAQNLPHPGADKVYELWLAAPTGALRPAGLLAEGSGRTTRLLEGPLAGAVAVGITIEPAGGSDQPTTAPLGIVSIA